MIIKKKKRRKKRRYITGVFKSLKSGSDIHYRSSWELAVCQFLEWDENVITYEYETVIIPYLSNLKTGKIRRYFADFLVFYKNNSKKLIEVKRADKINELKTAKKLKAGEEWCKKENMEFEIWDDNKIKQIKTLLGIKPIPKKKTKKKKKVQTKTL